MSDFFQSLGNYVPTADMSEEQLRDFDRQVKQQYTDEHLLSASYGGGLRGQSGARYKQLGGMAEAASNRPIGMTMGEQMAMNDLSASRGMQAESLNAWRGQALGTSPSLAMQEAQRQAAASRGMLMSGAASARGGAASAAFAQRQAMNAASMAEGDIMSRGGEAALMERERARAAYLENAGQMRGMEQGLYGAESGRTMTGQRLNDARSLGLLGMQETVADNERNARQDWVAMRYGINRQQADADARAAEAAAQRNQANTQLAMGLTAGAVSGGAGALAHMGSNKQPTGPGAAGGSSVSGGAAAAGAMFGKKRDE